MNHPATPYCSSAGACRCRSRCDVPLGSPAGTFDLLEGLRRDGLVYLPFLGVQRSKLAPAQHEAAWEALRDSRVAELLHSHPANGRRLNLTDEGVIDHLAQPNVGFVAKTAKAHLTVPADADWLQEHRLLPSSVCDYLAQLHAFAGEMRQHLDEIVQPDLPTRVTVRVFRYAGETPGFSAGMRPHVDGSVLTVVLAGNDGCLRCRGEDAWVTAKHPEGRDFAVLLSGRAAWHCGELSPTPHEVLPSAAPRESVAVFLQPDLLSDDPSEARAAIARWRLWPGLPAVSSVAA